MVKGTITRSPTFRFLTSGPSSTTSPMNSWPRMSPCSRLGMKALYRCRSEPQIAVLVTRMMASCGLMIEGSGTFCTRTSSLPHQHSAFIGPPELFRVSCSELRDVRHYPKLGTRNSKLLASALCVELPIAEHFTVKRLYRPDLQRAA